jgi:hypothetical protein
LEKEQSGGTTNCVAANISLSRPLKFRQKVSQKKEKRKKAKTN